MSEDTAARQPDLIEREAIAWFTRMRGRPTATEKRDFAAWREAAPEHARAYAGLDALWSEMGAPARRIDDAEGDLAEPLRKIAQLRRRRRVSEAVRSAAGRAAVGCLLVGAGAGWLWVSPPAFVRDIGADQITARAERRTVTLADGSTVLMDADTALGIEISGTERRVRLLRGGAFFSVRPSAVPFIVEAEGGEARVLGTEFDVTLDAERDVTVTLSRGRLEVAPARGDGSVVLAPGQSVVYGAEGLGAVRAADLEESMAWHEGRFVFNNARLADVLEQIGRYRAGRILLVGPGIGARRVSGNVSLDAADAALEALQASVGFRMVRMGNALTLIGP